jgi:hypothetical protein
MGCDSGQMNRLSFIARVYTFTTAWPQCKSNMPWPKFKIRVLDFPILKGRNEKHFPKHVLISPFVFDKRGMWISKRSIQKSVIWIEYRNLYSQNAFFILQKGEPIGVPYGLPYYGYKHVSTLQFIRGVHDKIYRFSRASNFFLAREFSLKFMIKF